MSLLPLLILSLLGIGFCEKTVLINEDDFIRFREPPLPISKSVSPFETKLEWIEQRVDNFDPQNNETYLMVNIPCNYSIIVPTSIFYYTFTTYTIYSDTTEMTNFSNLVHQFSFTLAVNGPYHPDGYVVVTCMKWPKN